MRNLAVEARMLVAAAGGRAGRPFLIAALSDLYGATPDIAEAWIDRGVELGMLRNRTDGTLGLAGALNRRHDTPAKAAVIRELWLRARRDQLTHWADTAVTW